jgi:hypothetical protein
MFPLFFARRMDYGEEEAAERVGAVASNGGEPLPAKSRPRLSRCREWSAHALGL